MAAATTSAKRLSVSEQVGITQNIVDRQVPISNFFYAVARAGGIVPESGECNAELYVRGRRQRQRLVRCAGECQPRPQPRQAFPNWKHRLRAGDVILDWVRAELTVSSWDIVTAMTCAAG